jgi:porin
LIRGLDSDAVGVGYFYAGLNREFKQLVNTLPTVPVQGVELYYNAAITPWIHLTGDVQVIDCQHVSDDTVFIRCLRAKIDI